ncbi:MAG: class I SAM-dependent methyltransferase [Anaerolineae bacterium]|jgi:SAM-dependent methyltransferase
MDVADYVKLWKLARRRLRSEKDYRELQAFQAALLLAYVRGFGVELEKRRVLDLGSGIGGYSEELATHGSRVISLDLIRPRASMQGGKSVMGSALSIPLRDRSVDFVLCASLIEHVLDPLRLLREIRRVLVKSGHCYLSFPPFYSPLGGHEFSPFHYLGESWAIRLKGQLRRSPEWVGDIYQVSPDPDSFSGIYQDWGLFKMTIAKARGLIKASGLETVDLSTRYLPISLIRWPILGEILTWHAQFLLKKPD